MRLVGWLVFNGNFSTNRIYRAIHHVKSRVAGSGITTMQKIVCIVQKSKY